MQSEMNIFLAKEKMNVWRPWAGKAFDKKVVSISEPEWEGEVHWFWSSEVIRSHQRLHFMESLAFVLLEIRKPLKGSKQVHNLQYILIKDFVLRWVAKIEAPQA